MCKRPRANTPPSFNARVSHHNLQIDYVAQYDLGTFQSKLIRRENSSHKLIISFLCVHAKHDTDL